MKIKLLNYSQGEERYIGRHGESYEQDHNIIGILAVDTMNDYVLN